jgi:hypothetical protein
LEVGLWRLSNPDNQEDANAVFTQIMAKASELYAGLTAGVWMFQRLLQQ